MNNSLVKVMSIMMLALIAHTVQAEAVVGQSRALFVRNSTNQIITYHAKCPIHKNGFGPHQTCNQETLEVNQIFKYSASGLCSICPTRVYAYTEDGEKELCNTGSDVQYRLMLVSIRQNGDTFQCEKSVDPEGTQKLFP